LYWHYYLSMVQLNRHTRPDAIVAIGNGHHCRDLHGGLAIVVERIRTVARRRLVKSYQNKPCEA
jgi:hypothetical protein